MHHFMSHLVLIILSALKENLYLNIFIFDKIIFLAIPSAHGLQMLGVAVFSQISSAPQNEHLNFVSAAPPIPLLEVSLLLVYPNQKATL